MFKYNLCECVRAFEALLKSEYAHILDEFYKYMYDIRCFKHPNLAQWQDDGDWYEIIWFELFTILLEPDSDEKGSINIEIRTYNNDNETHVFHCKSFSDLYDILIRSAYFSIIGTCHRCNNVSTLLHGLCEKCDDALR